eukprot:6138683-Pyramimonas_sp.AAC.1
MYRLSCQRGARKRIPGQKREGEPEKDLCPARALSEKDLMKAPCPGETVSIGSPLPKGFAF